MSRETYGRCRSPMTPLIDLQNDVRLQILLSSIPSLIVHHRMITSHELCHYTSPGECSIPESRVVYQSKTPIMNILA